MLTAKYRELFTQNSKNDNPLYMRLYMLYRLSVWALCLN